MTGEIVESAVKHAKLKTLSLPLLALALALVVGPASGTAAQTTATTQTAASAPDGRPVAPQVVTVIHRLNGIKVLRLLLRSGAVGAVDTMDEAFSMTSEVHTNIIAGLVLADGETIAVWLPEADVELDARGPFSPTTAPPLSRPVSPARGTASRSMELTSNLVVTPELVIIGRDGQRHPAQYIGLDGLTGLSLLKITDHRLPLAGSTRDAAITINQRVRLFSPEPVTERPESTSSTVAVRIGEAAATVTSLKRGLAAEIKSVRVNSTKLSAANVGGVAIDDDGQTVGIISGVEGNEANILAPAVIRGAAQRVLARKGSVPRPWLGVSGESLAFTRLEGIVQRGWEPARALSLLKNQSGIMLTSITPGSPAEMAALRAGDVIVSVNNTEVKSADDFSLFLEAAGESPVLFTIVRPNHAEPESVTIKLSEILNPLSTLTSLPVPGPEGLAISPLIRQGIETLALRPASAARLNPSGGLLVIYVQPQSPAARAGLQPVDIIQAINGQPILKTAPQQVQALTATSYTLSIIRDKRKLVLMVNTSVP